MTPSTVLVPRASWGRPWRDPHARSPLQSPGIVLATVLSLWVLAPSPVLSQRSTWVLLAVSLGLVGNALWATADRVRPGGAVLLFGVSALVGLVTITHTAGLVDLVVATAGAVLLTAVATLATACRPEDRRRLVDGVLLVSVLELTVAAASTFLGTPAPWGYLGRPGSTFGVNELVPFLDGRATGTMGHPIPLGLLLAVASLLAAFASPHLPALARWTVSAGAASGVLLSGSRSAALALVVGLLAGALLQPSGRHGLARRSLAGLVVLLIVPLVDVREISVFSSLEGTGSLTHRLGSFDAGVRLLGRPLSEVVLGSGTDSLSHLFSAGFLQQDGFFAVDNQLVTTLATSGLVGLVALTAALVVGVLRGSRATRPALVATALMLFSFDALLWTSCALLLAVLLGMSRAADDARTDEVAPT